MTEPKHIEDVDPKDQARHQADAAAEAEELEVKQVEPVDTVAAPRIDEETE